MQVSPIATWTKTHQKCYLQHFHMGALLKQLASLSIGGKIAFAALGILVRRRVLGLFWQISGPVTRWTNPTKVRPG